MSSEQYRDFMYDIDNLYNCGNCPENNGNTDTLPCGQQHCWVDVHCARLVEDSDLASE